MFELFSQRARQVIFIARLKAGQRGAKTIEIEDLIVGFITEDQGEFEKVFSDFFPQGGPVTQAGPQTASVLPASRPGQRPACSRAGAVHPVSASSQ